MKKLVLAALLSSTLVGCGQQASTSSQSKHQSNTSSPQTTNQQPTNQKPVDQQAIDKQSFKDYWNQVQTPFANLESDVENVSQIMLEGSRNPNEIVTADYRQRVQQACDTMNSDSQKIENIPESNDSKVAAIQDEILAGVKQVQYVAENLPNAVDTLNSNEITSCTNAFNNASNDFTNATSMIKNFQSSENNN